MTHTFGRGVSVVIWLPDAHQLAGLDLALSDDTVLGAMIVVYSRLSFATTSAARAAAMAASLCAICASRTASSRSRPLPGLDSARVAPRVGRGWFQASRLPRSRRNRSEAGAAAREIALILLARGHGRCDNRARGLDVGELQLVLSLQRAVLRRGAQDVRFSLCNGGAVVIVDQAARALVLCALVHSRWIGKLADVARYLGGNGREIRLKVSIIGSLPTLPALPAGPIGRYDRR